MANNIRWAFNAKDWRPTYDQMLAISSYIQPEEKQRISKFFFIEDAKSSLVGRLLLRKYIFESTDIPYENIRFGRNDSGKPFLLNTNAMLLSFNVSHQGDYAVLAGIADRDIGVDIMKIEPPANKDIQEFFRVMQRQFSPQEWRFIKAVRNEHIQISRFYRLWCLKESYVKNLGVGLTIPLKDISFSIKHTDLKIGELVKNTVLYKENVICENMVFIESLLDESHAVSVAIRTKDGDDDRVFMVKFDILDFEELVKGAKAFCEPDPQFAAEFIRKKTKDL